MLKRPSHVDRTSDCWTFPHLRRFFRYLDDVVANRDWTRAVILDLAKIACATLLFVAPWLFAFAPVPAWNLWIVGYLMLTCGLAEFLAEADWEAQTNCCLGAWVLSAPWILGFSSSEVATIVHVAGGSCVCILSAVELWDAKCNPPWRFGPGSALRAALLSSIITPRHRPAKYRWTSRMQRSGVRTGRQTAARGSFRAPRRTQLAKASARWARAVHRPEPLSLRHPMEMSRVA
jgi:SPW repeat